MHWMILPFKRYAEFSGRSRRMEFWMFQLLNIIVAIVLAGPFMFALFGALAADPGSMGMSEEEIVMAAFSGVGGIMLGLYGIYILASLIPSIAVTVRRFHDRDMSGWWYLGLFLAGLLPLVGWIASIALLVFMLLPGTPGPNRFGEDPKDPLSTSVFE